MFDEIERIKRKKMAKYTKMIEEKKKEEEQEIQERQFLNKILLPDAANYLNSVVKPSTAKKIRRLIINLILSNQIPIDQIEPLTKLDIKILERKVEGKESKIFYQKRGEETRNLSDLWK